MPAPMKGPRIKVDGSATTVTSKEIASTGPENIAKNEATSRRNGGSLYMALLLWRKGARDNQILRPATKEGVPRQNRRPQETVTSRCLLLSVLGPERLLTGR